MLRSAVEALQPDPRFATMCVNDGTGFRTALFEDHHAVVSDLVFQSSAPDAVHASFSRALQCFLYAWFDYDLMVVAEGQALASVELALKLRVATVAPKAKNMKSLFDVAYKQRFLAEPLDVYGANLHHRLADLRNSILHGTADVHAPAMTERLMQICAAVILELYPPSP